MNKIVSITMALLILITSTGFTMDVHYCQNQVKSVSLIGKAKSCHQELEKDYCNKQKKKNCHSNTQHSEPSVEKNKCCSNKTIIVESDDNAKKNHSTELTQQQVTFLTTFAQVFILKNTDLRRTIVPHLNYIPPLLDRDIPILIQSFLI